MRKIVVIAAGLALMTMGATGAWAGPWGNGPGYGPGNGQGRGYGPGYQGQQLSKEDLAKLHEKRAAFMKETLPLRQKMATTAIELRTEQFQLTPDQAKIKALNNEMIELRSQMAKKANDAGLTGSWRQGRGQGRGHARGMMRGYGGSQGPGMMGYGGGGPGSCWR